MTNIRSALRLAASSVLAAALLAPALAAADGGSKKFTAQFGTYEALTMDPSRCPVFTGETTGRGQASRLGVVSLAASDCVTPQPDGTFRFGPGPGAGSFTITAANGERLTGTYSGVLVPVSTTAPLYAIQGGVYRFTGGTGSLAGSTGEGTLQGLLLLGEHKGQPVASGTIALEGTLSR